MIRLYLIARTYGPRAAYAQLRAAAAYYRFWLWWNLTYYRGPMTVILVGILRLSLHIDRLACERIDAWAAARETTP